MQRAYAAAALPSLVAGLLIGACLALTAACGILLSARRVLPGMAATSTPLVSRRIARATSTPMSAASTMLLEAEALLRDGDPQASIELLSPWLTELIREDRVRTYDLMGQAELELGHPGLAGASFDRAYGLVPLSSGCMRLHWGMTLAETKSGLWPATWSLLRGRERMAIPTATSLWPESIISVWSSEPLLRNRCGSTLPL